MCSIAGRYRVRIPSGYNGTIYERGDSMDENKVDILETLSRLEAELDEREKNLVSEDGKALAAMLRESLQIAKRQAAGDFQ